MAGTLMDILGRLELTDDEGLFFAGSPCKQCSSRIKISLQYIKYDAIYTINNSPLIIFREFKTLEEFEVEFKQFRKAVWNLNEVPIIFVILPDQIQIYNGFSGFEENKEKEDFLKTFNKEDKLALKEFEPSNVTSEEFWEKYGEKFKEKETVQDYLLRNLRITRDKLNKADLEFPIIHNLFGRIIFAKYLVDRGILTQKFFQKNYESRFEDIIGDKKSLYKFFDYLKSTFNGDLFPVTPDEKDKVKDNHLKLLSEFLKGTDIETGQTLLSNRYDFKIIPIELISNIYETFLNQGKADNQAHYTPLFLVDYILDEKLNTHLENKNSCKILDPSCGSGVFLVESLRRLIEKKLEQKNKLTEFELKEIVRENIFGVDIDPDAINISIFSIYLTLLDYQDNKNIEDFTFPKLINQNFFVSDFFDLENEFNGKIGKFDLIIGNPPWGNVPGLHKEYYNNKKIPVSYNQIAETFLFRATDFAHNDSEIALIVTSKILYNITAADFRKYFLQHYIIEKVLEFSPVRKEVFNDAIGPGAILFYRLKPDENDGTKYIQHVSLKPNRLFYLLKSIVIQKYDVKFVPQSYFIKYDWLWAVLVYGSFLDFHFIKRLKEDYKSIEEIIQKNNLIEGQGIQDNESESPQDASNLVDKNYLDVGNQKKMLHRYYIDKSQVSKWTKKWVHRRREPELFEPPYILIKKGLDSEFLSVGTFSHDEWVFKDGVTAIKGTEEDEELLLNILGLLNSKLAAYYIHATSSSTGIERSQVHNPEKFSFPAVLDNQISNKVYEILQLKEEIGIDNSNAEITAQKELDEHLYFAYDLNDLERDLVDYAFEVAIPLYQTGKARDKVFSKVKKSDLILYADIFIKHFDAAFTGQDEFFVVESHITPQFVAMEFKVVPEKPLHKVQFKEENDVKTMINNLGNLSIQKRNSLYIQRDMKIFKETSFYVIKPNERQNWHRAVARLDVIEFMRDLR